MCHFFAREFAIRYPDILVTCEVLSLLCFFVQVFIERGEVLIHINRLRVSSYADVRCCEGLFLRITDMRLSFAMINLNFIIMLLGRLQIRVGTRCI